MKTDTKLPTSDSEIDNEMYSLFQDLFSQYIYLNYYYSVLEHIADDTESDDMNMGENDIGT